MAAAERRQRGVGQNKATKREIKGSAGSRTLREARGCSYRDGGVAKQCGDDGFFSVESRGGAGHGKAWRLHRGSVGS